jgi:hypothetical protein
MRKSGSGVVSRTAPQVENHLYQMRQRRRRHLCHDVLRDGLGPGLENDAGDGTAIAMREYENLAAFYLQAPSCIKNDDGEEAPCTSTTNWMI